MARTTRAAARASGLDFEPRVPRPTSHISRGHLPDHVVRCSGVLGYHRGVCCHERHVLQAWGRRLITGWLLEGGLDIGMTREVEKLVQTQ